MKIDKFAELKKQEWYDRDWSMTPFLWMQLKRCYDAEKTVKEIHEICWGDKK